MFKFIDPSTILLELVSEPIKEYLRSRKDTLRCIVKTILSDDNPELYQQLGTQFVSIPNVSRDKRNEGYISSDEDEQAAEKWEPLPLSKNEEAFFISARRRQSDIISTLVNIYGSQQEFIKVYTQMFDQRLINDKNMSYEKELFNLELMKKRFGDRKMDDCEVMLKDTKDSERINREVQKLSNGSRLGRQSKQMPSVDKLYVKVVSTGFWENFTVDDSPIEEEESNLKLGEGFMPSEEFKNCLREYEEHYKKYRGLRYLIFKQALGRVDLTLTFDNGDFSFKVYPLQAVVIQQFGSDDHKQVALSIDYLQNVLSNPNSDSQSVSISSLKDAIGHWERLGVLIALKENRYTNVLEYHAKDEEEEVDSEQATIFVQHHHSKVSGGQKAQAVNPL